MRRVEVSSYPVSIFIATGLARRDQVRAICREHCDTVGLCVTVTDTSYCYTGGQEEGVIIGLIHYPRFPSDPAEIWARAETLAEFMRIRLHQESYTIQAPDKTVWFSHRADNAA